MSAKSKLDNLVILEMANNHMGDVAHGVAMIKAFADVCKGYPFQFGFKFQYRELDSFIHESYRGDFSFKYIKRFQETRLDRGQFAQLRDAARESGFLAVCTPFDEASVDRIVDEGYDILKIASCSLGDWPLMEKIATADLPVIFSTAGAEAESIRRMFLFYKHRRKQFAMLHCVGAYPTAPESADLNQLDFLRKEFPEAILGYSGHEEPGDTTCAMVAAAKGARVFERHVGLPTEKYKLNAYSSTPQQIKAWLDAIVKAQAACGGFKGARAPSEKEIADLHGLRRGCYLRCDKKAGDQLRVEDLDLAMPNLDDHLTACDLSRYTKFELKEDLAAGSPVKKSALKITNHQKEITDYMRTILGMLEENRIHLPHLLNFEFSHHYGLSRFREFGAAIINCVNREYCKKIVVVFPGQRHPNHYHKQKEETFQVLHGELLLDLGDGEKAYAPGDIVLVERGKWHAFRSKRGVIFEEVSTTHRPNDSVYEDQEIMKNKDRKTAMSFWANDYPKEFGRVRS